MPPKSELFILYQMGNSEEWTWYSPIGVFFSEDAAREYASKNGIPTDIPVRTPDSKNEISLKEPVEYVIVESEEGEVPEVELSNQG